MEKLADIGTFESLQAQANQQMGFTANGAKPMLSMGTFNDVASLVENAPIDVYSNPNGTVTPGQPVHKDRTSIPERDKTLAGRVKVLEDDMKVVKENMKTGFAEVKQVVAEIKDRMVTKDDLKQMFGNGQQ